MIAVALGCGSTGARPPPNTALSRDQHLKFFPIASGPHAVDCNSCHGTAESFRGFTCVSCHEHDQQTMASKHQSVGGFVWSASAADTSAACIRCHADGQVDRVAAHTPFSLLQPSKHFQASCLACHAAARTDKPFGQDFTRKDCSGCHTEGADKIVTRHSIVIGFVNNTASCLVCHPDGGKASSVDHAPIFPIAAGDKHALGSRSALSGAPIDCASCHVNPADRKQVDCTGCHKQALVDPKHLGLVGGYGFQATALATSRLCLQCHADAQVTRVATHSTAPSPANTFRIASGVKHNAANVACFDCHTAARTDKPFVATDFKQHQCLACHAPAAGASIHSQSHIDGTHRGFGGYSFSTPACLRCHPAGSKP
jgi:hypothetical protein